VGNRSSLVVVNEWGAGAPVEHTVTHRPGGDTVIRTAALEVVVSAAATVPGNGSGGAAAAAAVSFFNASTGEALLAEIGREFTESAVTQSWDSPSTESLYGLGHYNFGILDFRLAPVDMTQWNLWKVVPFMVSTRGWGLLWDTSYATAHLNPVQDSEAVQLGAWVVRPALPTDPTPTRAYNSSAALWSEATGTVTVTAAGPHWVYAQLPTLIWCSHAARVKVGNVTVIDLFDDPCNLPPSTLERVMLEPGEHVVTVQSWAQSENKLQPRVWVRGEAAFGNRTSWQSDRSAASTDYYFMAGGSISRSIGLYRQATGAAPMPPRAIFGFMHSKDRFKNQTSLLAAAGGFRAGGYPIDTIVQDWYFWPKLQNSFQNHGFDPTRYPDPAQMTAQLKDKLNLHFMVTYWPKVDGPLRQELANQTPPALIGSVCDQYNPAGRELYYGYANTTKYAMGVDFSWLCVIYLLPIVHTRCHGIDCTGLTIAVFVVFAATLATASRVDEISWALELTTR
jgi:alpha-D-xyloside xylohydrolase